MTVSALPLEWGGSHCATCTFSRAPATSTTRGLKFENGLGGVNRMPPNSILRISTGRGLVRGGRRAGPPGKIGELHGNGGKAAEAAWRPGRAQRGKGDRLLRGGRAGARRAVLRSRARRQAQRRAQGRQWAGGARLALCGERTIQASRSHKILKSTPIARVIGVVPFSHGDNNKHY